MKLRNVELLFDLRKDGHMDLEIFEHMDTPKLRQYMEFLLQNYRLWMRFGLST